MEPTSHMLSFRTPISLGASLNSLVEENRESRPNTDRNPEFKDSSLVTLYLLQNWLAQG